MAVSQLTKLSAEKKARLAEQVIEAYGGGAKIRDLAGQLGVHEKTLHRFMRNVDPKGWLIAQEVRLAMELEDMGPGTSESQRKSWDFREAKLAARKRAFQERR